MVSVALRNRNGLTIDLALARVIFRRLLGIATRIISELKAQVVIETVGTLLNTDEIAPCHEAVVLTNDRGDEAEAVRKPDDEAKKMKVVVAVEVQALTETATHTVIVTEVADDFSQIAEAEALIDLIDREPTKWMNMDGVLILQSAITLAMVVTIEDPASIDRAAETVAVGDVVHP
jgi:hypothetical protein